jgi:AbrB family looped-hinge helix DNA binding protein
MSKVTDKYQITIPPRVRKELGIVPGCKVDIKKVGNKYVLVVDPVKELVRRWRGKLKGGKPTDEYMDEVRGEVD